MDTNRLKLFRVLIAKSIAETLFVGTLAVAFFFTTFPPSFQGWGEATHDAIAGWVVNNSQPWARVEVQLFIDGRFVSSGSASRSRPDVLAAGWARDEWHGYIFDVPKLPAGIHDAHVYAVHESGNGIRQTLQLVGHPIRFKVDEQGKLTDLTRSGQ